MAERRMFAKTIIDSDAFLDMPVTARLLYYDLAMRADDDGFINSPKKIMKMIGASQDDLSILAIRKFIIPFDNGVVVIKHWRIHNYIRRDTYKETPYKEEKALLELDENNSYRLSDGVKQLTVNEPSTNRQRTVNEPSTQDRIGKDRIGKDRTEKNISPKDPKHIYGEYGHVRLTDAQKECLIETYGEELALSCIQYLDEYIEMKGYKAKNHYLCIRKWVVDAVSKQKQTGNKVADQLEKSYAMMSKWAEEGS